VNPAALAAAGAGVAGLALSLRFHWWRPRKPGVPILMYHQVGPHRTGSPLNRWRVPPADFARQMDHLAALGLRGVALRDLLDRPDAPEKRVVLTFDDGYDAIRTAALPLLLARGFSATVFAVSGRLGGTNDWDGERPGEALLSADSVRDLHAAGLEIGSHGATHRALTSLADGELAAETAGSRAALEELLDAPVVSFCYPYGACDARAAEAVRHAGYRAATVIRGGIANGLSDPLRLPRVAVRGTGTFLDFRLALTRGRSKF
jgi:peptidoglycan/xylan/chitin deacetylase (PgdA/CDA1 family)